MRLFFVPSLKKNQNSGFISERFLFRKCRKIDSRAHSKRRRQIEPNVYELVRSGDYLEKRSPDRFSLMYFARNKLLFFSDWPSYANKIVPSQTSYTNVSRKSFDENKTFVSHSRFKIKYKKGSTN